MPNCRHLIEVLKILRIFRCVYKIRFNWEEINKKKSNCFRTFKNKKMFDNVYNGK